MSQRPDSPRDFWVGFVIGLLLSIVVAVAFVWTGEAHAQVSERIFRDGFGDDEAGGQPLPVDPCDELPGEDLIAPFGWQRIDKTWQETFSSPDGTPQASFPVGVGFPVPVPGRLPGRAGPRPVPLADYVPKGSVTVIGPFIAPAHATVTLTWDTAQANGGQGYGQPRPAIVMFVRVSECAADLRIGEADPCARVAGGASLVWTTKPGTAACTLEAGRAYYYSVAMANPRDGLTFGEHTCSDSAANSAGGCDVQMRHTAVVTAQKEP